ncbi:hypothetical protein GCM10010218_60740 [Streptomyces mashuensis]|uniref:Uncharacterized protein n=1 Tax=Streptomyces mashuensis TaxID=33904 RepID=A0A919B9A6_9ACTN|nr:hypothetical protein [Streptomyces mashuensis]GHF71406.1 hypothetical protein GCM10010218_60740 [Streptomyces mashuensis]
MAAATRAAETARSRTAEHLLAARLEQLHEQQAMAFKRVAVPEPWDKRLTELPPVRWMLKPPRR